MNKILLLCPLKLEYQFLKQGFEDQGFKISETPFFKKTYTEIKGTPYILSYAGLGKVNFAHQTFQICEYFKASTSFKVDGLCCLGSAGALGTSLKIGDLILSLITVEHDYKSSMDNFKHPTFSAAPFFSKNFCAKLNLDSEVINLVNLENQDAENLAAQKIELQFKNSSTDLSFRTFLGRVASGDEDILTPERATSLYASTQAHATAWEGAGAARAAASLGLDFMEIRAISDHCTSETPQDFKKNLKLCMEHLAQFLIHMA